MRLLLLKGLLLLLLMSLLGLLLRWGRGRGRIYC
tara:strand:- start:5023 stop:5124 length:102 start_codon:yes stop_codon:yes gene_type:complete